MKAKFSATDVAFTGFGVVRRHPFSVLLWALLHAIFIGGLGYYMAASGMAALLAKMTAEGATHARDPKAALAMLSRLATFYPVPILVSILASAVFTCAMNRVVLRPREDFFGFIWFGGDELRQIGLILLTAVVALGAYLGVVVVIVAGAFALAAIAGAVHGAPWLVPTLAIAFAVALFCATIFVLVRLSLAAALTFDSKKINLFGSWTLTRGQFWPMLGAYVLAALTTLVAGLVASMLVALVLAIAFGFSSAGLAFHRQAETVAELTALPAIVALMLNALVYAILLPLMGTPPAAIYKALTAKDAPAAA